MSLLGRYYPHDTADHVVSKSHHLHALTRHLTRTGLDPSLPVMAVIKFPVEPATNESDQ